MKDSEEYLLLFEERYFEKFKSLHKNIDKSVFLILTLVLIVFLYKVDFIENASLFGAKLKVEHQEAFLVVSIMIILCYFVVGHSLDSISKLFLPIYKNSQRIELTNPNSTPLRIYDLSIFSSGVLGLQFKLVYKFINYFVQVSYFRNNMLNDYENTYEIIRYNHLNKLPDKIKFLGTFSARIDYYFRLIIIYFIIGGFLFLIGIISLIFYLAVLYLPMLYIILFYPESQQEEYFFSAIENSVLVLIIKLQMIWLFFKNLGLYLEFTFFLYRERYE